MPYFARKHGSRKTPPLRGTVRNWLNYANEEHPRVRSCHVILICLPSKNTATEVFWKIRRFGSWGVNSKLLTAANPNKTKDLYDWKKKKKKMLIWEISLCCAAIVWIRGVHCFIVSWSFKGLTILRLFRNYQITSRLFVNILKLFSRRRYSEVKRCWWYFVRFSYIDWT